MIAGMRFACDAQGWCKKKQGFAEGAENKDEKAKKDSPATRWWSCLCHTRGDCRMLRGT